MTDQPQMKGFFRKSASMPGITEWLAVVVALLCVLSSGVIGYLVYTSTRQAQRAEMQREIGHLYDQLMDFRAEHPEVLALSRRWNVGSFEAIYRQRSDEERQLALYYTYAEPGKMAREGWDWQEMHRVLPGPGDINEQ